MKKTLNKKKPKSSSSLTPGGAKSTLNEVLKQSLSEERLYRSYFHQEFWTVEEFAALMAGLTPEKYRAILDGKLPPTPKDMDRCSQANKLGLKFAKMTQAPPYEKGVLVDQEVAMTPWRFLRWVALNTIPMRVGFFKRLPFYLMETYLKFQPADVILSTQSKLSREYHRALYLQKAEQLLEEEPDLTPTEIYRDPRMKGIQQSFVDHGGKHISYKRRTIIESWLPKLIKRAVGRPKKPTY